MIILDNNNNRDYDKKDYLRNGVKSQGQYGKSSFNTTVESGAEAKKRGF